ncbi:MAG: TraB family protein, partial [Leptospiraceae bacterium]|nr:TraB family protein [Leptospiraceae bacterium]
MSEETTEEKIQTEPLRKIKIKDCELNILGTAHVSKKSVEAVESFIQQEKPDTVCVELCQSRMNSMKDPNYLQKLDIFKVFKERKMYLLLSNLILSSFQKKIGGEVKPGDELRKAISEAENIGAKIVPVDREVQTTLKRSWGNVGFFSKMYLLSNLIASLLVKEDISPDKIEEMKSEDALKDLFSQLPARYSEIKNVIIDERDIYLAENIRRASFGSKKLFAVVGAGHLEGIIKHIENENKIEALDKKPKKSLLQKSSVLIIPFLL